MGKEEVLVILLDGKKKKKLQMGLFRVRSWALYFSLFILVIYPK